jgi:hypothetical protein
MCGDTHDDDTAVKAGIAFQRVAQLIAGETEGKLEPHVLLHVVGLLGALLIHYSDFEYADVIGQIAQLLENEPALEKVHSVMTELGFAGGLEPKAH